MDNLSHISRIPKPDILFDETGEYKELAKEFGWEIIEIDGKMAYQKNTSEDDK